MAAIIWQETSAGINCGTGKHAAGQYQNLVTTVKSRMAQNGIQKSRAQITKELQNPNVSAHWPRIIEVAEFTVGRDPLRGISQDTVKWHQNDPIRNAALEKWYLENGTASSFGYQLARVAAIFAGYKAEALFIQGKDFDMGLVSSESPTMATEFQVASQIPYYHTHCLRDVEALLHGLGTGFKKLKRVKQHTAASDCSDNLHCVFHALDFIYYNR
jgi:hypothetical protein